jgi:uncharacterized Zn finger protein (UPF0148 family)
MPECRKCGAKYKRGDLFCSKCGKKVKVEKPRAHKKQPRAKPTKKAKPELSEDVKRKLKGELEISIKAFKRGDISLEEFQDIKKSIVAKAKAGFYNEPENRDTPPPVIESTVSSEIIQPAATGELHKPVRRKDEPPFSKLWYLAPVVFNIFGGIVAYFAIKDLDDKSAKRMIAIGLLSFIIIAGGIGYYLSSQNMYFGGDDEDVPTEIVIAGEEDTIEDVLDLTETIPINATNNSAEEMNIELDDLEPDFYIVTYKTGVLNDPVEYSGGNSTLASELETHGWLENHRVVMKKDFVDSGEIITEKEIDSEISKYDASKVTSSYLADKLLSFETMLIGDDYSTVEGLNLSAGVMGKKIDSDGVTYKVFFHKQDTTVSLRISGVTRGLNEEEVMEYAYLIEERIE